MLKNKIVLIGTTAAGLLDLRVTPVHGNYLGWRFMSILSRAF